MPTSKRADEYGVEDIERLACTNPVIRRILDIYRANVDVVTYEQCLTAMVCQLAEHNEILIDRLTACLQVRPQAAAVVFETGTNMASLSWGYDDANKGQK